MTPTSALTQEAPPLPRLDLPPWRPRPAPSAARVYELDREAQRAHAVVRTVPGYDADPAIMQVLATADERARSVRIALMRDMIDSAERRLMAAEYEDHDAAGAAAIERGWRAIGDVRATLDEMERYYAGRIYTDFDFCEDAPAEHLRRIAPNLARLRGIVMRAFARVRRAYHLALRAALRGVRRPVSRPPRRLIAPIVRRAARRRAPRRGPARRTATVAVASAGDGPPAPGERPPAPSPWREHAAARSDGAR